MALEPLLGEGILQLPSLCRRHEHVDVANKASPQRHDACATQRHALEQDDGDGVLLREAGQSLQGSLSLHLERHRLSSVVAKNLDHFGAQLCLAAARL